MLIQWMLELLRTLPPSDPKTPLRRRHSNKLRKSL
jgi:hypothetical protein